MRPFAHVPSACGTSPRRTSRPSTFRLRRPGSGLLRSRRSHPSSSRGERSHTTRPHSSPPQGSIATCAAPPSAYQTPTGEAADARSATPRPIATRTRVVTGADLAAANERPTRRDLSTIPCGPTPFVPSIASPPRQRVHDEAHHRFPGDRLLDGLRVRVPVPVHRPEHGRLDQQPGRDGGIGERSEELPACPILEILRE